MSNRDLEAPPSADASDADWDAALEPLWAREWDSALWPDAWLDRWFIALAARQAERCAPLAAYWRTVGFEPARATRWTDIVGVPSSLFKRADIVAFSGEPAALFRSSGTTSAHRSAHAFRTLRHYRAASVQTWSRLVDRRTAALPVVALVPHPTLATDSSLSAMLGFLSEHRTAPFHWAFAGRIPTVPELDQVVAILRRYAGNHEPVQLFGTAFAYVHLLDRMRAQGTALRLAAGSGLVETGGFKGLSRELPRRQLYDDLAALLGVPAERIVNEYGMSELSSQFYGNAEGAAAQRATQGAWVGPPWLRARALHPDTLAIREPGEWGVLGFWDLANLDSCVAVRTHDVGRVFEDGSLELRGRAAGATPRGCSIAFDMAIGATRDIEAQPARVAADLPPFRSTADGAVAQIRALTPIERAQVLQRVAQRWCDHVDPRRAEVVQQVALDSGLPADMVREGLDDAMAAWLAPAWEHVVRRELGDFELASAPSAVAVLGAGTVPSGIGNDVAAGWLAGALVFARPSVRGVSWLAWLADAVGDECPAMRHAMHIAHERDEFVAGLPFVDAIIASGSESTLRSIASHVRLDTPALWRSSRWSVALACGDLDHTALQRAADAIARDVAMWDHEGCLSPSFVVHAGDVQGARKWARALDAALAATFARWPARIGGVDERARLLERRDDVRASAVGGEFPWVGQWTCVVPPGAGVTPTGGRFVPVLMASELDEIPVSVAQVGAPLSCVSAAGDIDLRGGWTREYERLGATRFCRAGQAQRPPLSWWHDGRERVRPLLVWRAREEF